MKKLTLDVLIERSSSLINDEILASIYGGNGSSDPGNPFDNPDIIIKGGG